MAQPVQIALINTIWEWSIRRFFVVFVFQLPYSDFTCLKCIELLLHIKSMQVSLIFWQHFWGQTRSCLPFTLHNVSTLNFLLTMHAPWIWQKYVKLDQKSRKSVQTSCHVNPMVEANFSIRWSPAPLSFTRSGWEGVPTKAAGNQRIAKSVQKGSTEIDHVTSLYLKWVTQKLQQYKDPLYSIGTALYENYVAGQRNLGV